jgi:hypothetical protein
MKVEKIFVACWNHHSIGKIMYVYILLWDTNREYFLQRSDKMSITEGTKYQISQGIKEFFNSAETMTVLSNNGITVQFMLGDSKGRGSMPLEHLNYLLKKDNLTLIPNKRLFLNTENSEEQIG